jgi:hypothetical protein
LMPYGVGERDYSLFVKTGLDNWRVPRCCSTD